MHRYLGRSDVSIVNFEQIPLPSLREKGLNTELILARIFLYLDWTQENTDQK